MAVHVNPGHTVGQLGRLIKYYDIVVQRKVQLREVVLILRRLAERQLACNKYILVLSKGLPLSIGIIDAAIWYANSSAYTDPT